jgi:hypothetical protein
MKRRRRGDNGGVHVYKPPGAQTFWIRYQQDGVQRRRNTGHSDESQARIFAATAARMVGLAQSESLDQQRKLLEIAEELIRSVRGLEGNVERLGRDRIVPSVRQWFNSTLEEMTNGANGDDRHLKDSSIERIQNVHDCWLQYLAGLQVNLADAPVNRIGPDEVRGFLAMKKAEGFSGSTRRYALARIRAVFGRAVDRGLIASNPAGVKQLGRLKFDDKSIRRAFNARQIAVILEAADTSPHR